MSLTSTRYLPQDTEPFYFANGRARVHAANVCEPDFPCVIHRHSDHDGADLPMVLNERGLVTHLDELGTEHPCPDSVAYFERTDPPITQHGIRCTQCGDELYSNSRHDFVPCECDAVFIDGGFDYIRVGGYAEDFIDVSREVRRYLLPFYYREEAAA